MRSKKIKSMANPHKNALTRECFIQRAVEVHGGLFDYSLVEYKNIDTRIKIVCKLHGVFQTTPYRHLKGVCCHICSGPKHRGFLENAKKSCLGTDGFIERAMKVHGDKYDYSRVEYVNNRRKVEVCCPVHGPFHQTPDNHMKGVGCPGCKFEKTGPLFLSYLKKLNSKVKKTFTQDMIKIHGDKYDYSETVYEKWDKTIKILCPMHGPFFQTANNHRAGRGCPQCATSGFDGTIPAILYYFEINRGEGIPPLYKIGVTNRTVKERYALKRDRRKIKIIKIWEYPLGYEARRMEQEIINLHKEKLYQGEPPLDEVGVAEIFTEDILRLTT